MKSSTTTGSTARTVASSLQSLIFDNRNINSLAVDQERGNFIRQVPNAIFSLVEPTAVQDPSVICISNSALELLGLDTTATALNEAEVAEYFSGNKLLPGSRPAAHCYCGHQFGSFAGQLGDGATMYLGEVINPLTQQRWELQLKGAGRTPYSRSADGRKVLRSSVREFLCSEAMHQLRVPTTRAASCVTSASTVLRDPMYDGNALHEPCTVITRIAPNFFRFGSFEIFKGRPKGDVTNYRSGPSAGNTALKQQLLNHVLLYYPDIVEKHSSSSGSSGPVTTASTAASVSGTVDMYEALFAAVVQRTAELCARWQSVGFVHGVLNTDNMSVMGLTIDYGPFGFMEQYDPDFVPNGSDGTARYSYQKQPEICKWNLQKFAEAIDPLLPLDVSMHILEETYWDHFEKIYSKLFGHKFGFAVMGSEEKQLLSDFFEVMTDTMTDFTDAFVALTEFNEQLMSTTATTTTAADAHELLLRRLVSRSAKPDNVVQALKRKIRIHRLSMHPQQIQQIWQLLEQAPEQQISDMFNGASVDAIRDEISGEKRKLDILIMASQDIKKYEMTSSSTKREKDTALWSAWCSRYAAHQSAQLQSAAAATVDRDELLKGLREHNPTVVLRNWLAQDAIEQAEARYNSKREDGSREDEAIAYAGVRTLLRLLEDPFNPEYSSFRREEQGAVKGQSIAASTTAEGSREAALVAKYTGTPPSWADGLICTCSS